MQVLVKGAPEVMMSRFEVVPPFYETTFKHFARQVPALYRFQVNMVHIRQPRPDFGHT